MLPTEFSNEKVLQLVQSLEGEYDYSQSEKSPQLLYFTFLVLGPAAVLLLYFFGDLEFPPQETIHWLYWGLIPSCIITFLIVRFRNIERIRFHDGFVYFIDKSDVVTKAIAVAQIRRIQIRNKNQNPHLRFTTESETFDYPPPESLVDEIRRFAKKA